MIQLTTYDGISRWYNPAQIVSVEECQHFEKLDGPEPLTTIYANGDWSVVRGSLGDILGKITGTFRPRIT